MDVTIEPYTWADDLTAADLESVVAIANSAWDEWIPGEPPMSTDAYRDEDRFTHAPEVVVRRLARDDRGEVVGMGDLQWRDGEPGTAVMHVFVSPDRRRQGVGRALAEDLAAAARASGRSGLTVEPALGSAAEGICGRAGFRPDLQVEQNRADLEAIDDAMLRAWVAAGEAAEGYSLVTYDAPCLDDALAADFIEARHVMNDAPRYEGEAEARFTVMELRAAEAAAAAANIRWWSVGVRHDASGRLVGLSVMYLADARRWLVFQGDTGVAPEHRGHRLGAWMKAANHLRLRAERPEAKVVQTWNAASNEPMLNINRALGFQPVQTYRSWYRPLD